MRRLLASSGRGDSLGRFAALGGTGELGAATEGCEEAAAAAAAMAAAAAALAVAAAVEAAEAATVPVTSDAPAWRHCKNCIESMRSLLLVRCSTTELTSSEPERLRFGWGFCSSRYAAWKRLISSCQVITVG